jgi:hypothetical protein
MIGSDRFQKLSNLPKLPEKYFKEALESEYVRIEDPVSYSTQCKEFSKSKFFNTLRGRFGWVEAVFLKNEPMSFYNWHIDKGRKCALNWPIQSSSDAFTFYRDSLEARPIHIMERVDYELFTPTLIDTTFRHCVLNNSMQERIILSIAISDRYSYKEVKQFLQELTITEY